MDVLLAEDGWAALHHGSVTDHDDPRRLADRFLDSGSVSGTFCLLFRAYLCSQNNVIV